RGAKQLKFGPLGNRKTAAAWAGWASRGRIDAKLGVGSCGDEVGTVAGEVQDGQGGRKNDAADAKIRGHFAVSDMVVGSKRARAALGVRCCGVVEEECRRATHRDVLVHRERDRYSLVGGHLAASWRRGYLGHRRRHAG